MPLRRLDHVTGSGGTNRRLVDRRPSRGPGAGLGPWGDPGAVPSEGRAVDSLQVTALEWRWCARAWRRLAGAVARPTGTGRRPPLSRALEGPAGAPAAAPERGPTTQAPPDPAAQTGQRRGLASRRRRAAELAVRCPARAVHQTALAASTAESFLPAAAVGLEGALRRRSRRPPVARCPSGASSLRRGRSRPGRYRRSSTARNDDGRRSRWGSAARPRGERGAPTISPRRSP